ncbi:hypothetical protein HQ520_08845, partial [bacterium]|nr:hypothetical protein [bacterium]
GMAWVDVDAGGGGVTVEISSGGEKIKSLTAQPGHTVTRFETRLEGLTAGDVIQVSAVPQSKSSYRLGFKIAFGTPTFAGKRTFDLHDFGAVGDGKTNDLPAIQKAIQAAQGTGGGVIRFDGAKTYYVKGGHCFHMDNTANIKIEGNGARLVLHPAFEFAVIRHSENIQIDGLTVAYDPLPYFQGHIKGYNIAPGNLSMDIEVPDRYAVPKTGKWLSRQFSRSFWLEPGYKRVGSGQHLYLDRVEALDSTGRSLRVYFRHDMGARLQDTKDHHAIELIVPERDFGHRSDNGLGYCYIHDCGRIALSNIRVENYCNMGFLPMDNWGPITFSNIDIQTPHPETELFVGWRDGWHVHANRFGILIEDSVFDGGIMYDDVFSPYLVLPDVAAAAGNTVKLDNGRMTYWHPGDWISFWDTDQMKRLGMARIAAIQPGDPVVLTLDHELDLPGVRYALNEDTYNRDQVVRNCETTPLGKGASVRLRTPIHFQSCKLDNIHFWTYSGENRSRPRNVVFEDTCIWDRLTLNTDNAWTIAFRRCTLDKTILEFENTPKAVVEDVQWTHSQAPIMRLEKASNVYISGNTTRNGQTDLAPWIEKSDDSTVHFEAGAGLEEWDGDR